MQGKGPHTMIKDLEKIVKYNFKLLLNLNIKL